MASDLKLRFHTILARLSSVTTDSPRGLSQSATTICLVTCTCESYPTCTEIFSQLYCSYGTLFKAYRWLLPLWLTMSFTSLYRVSLAGVRRGTQISLQHSVNLDYNVHSCGFHTVQVAFNTSPAVSTQINTAFVILCHGVTFTPTKSSTTAEFLRHEHYTVCGFSQLKLS